jgi:hypothetical protein
MTSEAKMPTVKKDSLILVGGGEFKKRGHTADVSSLYGNFFFRMRCEASKPRRGSMNARGR